MFLSPEQWKEVRERWQETRRELDGKFLDHKANNNALIQAYERLGMPERASKVYFCGSELEFNFSVSPPKLFRANFCKDRLCNMCSWRRSLKIFGQVSKVMDKLQENNFEFLFITLTVRNCSASDLKRELDKLQYSFHLFHKQKRVKRAFQGCFKAFEITHHPDKLKSIEYHPHLHLIVAVKKSYFKTDAYMKHEELLQIWRDVCCLEYDPFVRIEKITSEKTKKKKDDEVSLAGAVAEVAKYCVKPSDYLNGTDEEIDDAVLTLIDALSSRRLCSFTGVFKKAAQELKLDDLTDGDLVHTDNEKLRSDVSYLILTVKWNVGLGRYCITRIRHEKEKQNDH